MEQMVGLIMTIAMASGLFIGIIISKLHLWCIFLLSLLNSKIESTRLKNILDFPKRIIESFKENNQTHGLIIGSIKNIGATLISYATLLLSPHTLSTCLMHLLSNLLINAFKLDNDTPEEKNRVELIQNTLFLMLEIGYNTIGVFAFGAASIPTALIRSYFIARFSESLITALDGKSNDDPNEYSAFTTVKKALTFVALDLLLPGSALAAGGSWVSKVTQSVLGSTGIER